MSELDPAYTTTMIGLATAKFGEIHLNQRLKAFITLSNTCDSSENTFVSATNLQKKIQLDKMSREHLNLLLSAMKHFSGKLDPLTITDLQEEGTADDCLLRSDATLF